MQAAVPVAVAQRVVAISLFVVATAPVCLLGIGAAFQFQPRDFYQLMIGVASYPSGGAQWFAYLALLVSTWAGATLASTFVVQQAGKPHITYYGVGFLGYSLLTVAFGLVFVTFGEAPITRPHLLAVLPPSLVDPTGADAPEAVTERANQAIEQMTHYVHWAIGSLLTLVAAVLAIPAPSTTAASAKDPAE